MTMRIQTATNHPPLLPPMHFSTTRGCPSDGSADAEVHRSLDSGQSGGEYRTVLAVLVVTVAVWHTVVAVRFSFEKIVTVRDREIFQPATEQGDGYEL
jgi:hypothetical protein